MSSDAAEEDLFHDQLALHASVAGVSLLSYEFVWRPEFRLDRFRLGWGESVDRPTTLDTVIRSELTPAQRHRIFPSPLDLGRFEPLEPRQRTYSAIADAVLTDPIVREKGITAQQLDEEFVKETATALSKITGFPFAQHRELDPDRASRALKLVVFLKKVYGPGVVGMLHSPGGRRPASLELTNPYVFGPKNEARYLFADIQSYLSAHLSQDRLTRIDTCFSALRGAVAQFMAAVLDGAVHGDSLRDGRHPTQREASDQLREAGKGYAEHLARLNTPSTRRIMPLDEQLYIHARALDFLHYAEFRRAAKDLQHIRQGVRPALVKYRVQTTPMRPRDIIDQVDVLMPLQTVVEHALAVELEPAVFRRSVIKASHVLRHFLASKTIDPDVTANTRQLIAAICFAIDLGEFRPAQEAYIRGQGTISPSLSAAIDDGVNARHEEFERRCVEAVEWYQAALIGQMDVHAGCIDLLAVFEQHTAKLCAAHDIEGLELFLEMLRDPLFSRAYSSRASRGQSCEVQGCDSPAAGVIADKGKGAQ